ncbi:MAG TPA: hypothetical protein VG498_22120 [Terriglobales bacterium]|nr:hypothetical protein [Terriglobales bacterium]
MNFWRGVWCLLSAYVTVALATTAFAQNSTDFTSVPLSSGSVQSRWLVTTDPHLQPNPVGALLLNSSFAHGFRHGYDEGFRAGDLDVQMGRSPRLTVKPSQSRQAGHEYKRAFGNKESFQQGYETGFKDGYSDAMAGLDYRASERAHRAAVGLTDALAPSRRPAFDEGFASGYRSAQSSSAPQMILSPDYVLRYCESTLLGRHPVEYCSGFSRGYIFAGSQISSVNDNFSDAHPQP